MSQRNFWPYQKQPGTRCPGTVVTVNADLEWVSLNVGLTLHWWPSYCSICSHPNTVGIPSTNTILWPSVLYDKSGRDFHLFENGRKNIDIHMKSYSVNWYCIRLGINNELITHLLDSRSKNCTLLPVNAPPDTSTPSVPASSIIRHEWPYL